MHTDLVPWFHVVPAAAAYPAGRRGGVAAAKGVTLCDLRTAFGSHLQIFNPTNLAKSVLTSDGVHLNGAGNVFLATEAARALRRAVLARD